jgi:dihydrofolate reductase
MAVVASISTSVDGYITGPNDREGNGLGDGGERLHYWVMGGPWTHDTDHDVAPAGMAPEDRDMFDSLTATLGAGICGRGMFEAAGRWGGTNPFGGTMFVLTHRLDDPPDASTGFVFVDDLADAMAQAAAAADGKDVAVSGGASVIRQALAAGYVDELTLTIAPVILGAGKRLFEGFGHDVDLEIRQVWNSPWATHVRYSVTR